VFDSAAGTPLAGAVVQLVRVDQGGTPTSATATFTNDRGRYRIEGVAPGRYLIGFQHEALSAFRVEAPAWRVDVSASTTAADSNVVVDLATPSAAELRAGLCSSNEGAGGLIAGRVADGRTGAPLEGATVTVRWSELAIQDDTLRPRPIERTSRVHEDGTYLICGASTEEPLAVAVAKAGYFTLRSELTIPNAGVVRRDQALAEIARSLGSGRVSGRVTRSDGAPVPSARVAIPSLALEQAVVNGRFLLNKVPNGRWLLEVRALGFAPWERIVEVHANASDEVTVAMVALPPTLETARVVAPRPMKDDLVIRGILERNRIAAGTMFLPGNPWLRDALFPADVVRAARGFMYKGPTTICARLGCISGGCVLAGDDLPPDPRIAGTKKTIVLYVDGERLRGGLPALNDFVPVEQILAIETYPDVMSAPFIWRSKDACAVIAVWTRKDQ
jgi:protocatechuate 3,4-dioxygenase beta subunit